MKKVYSILIIDDHPLFREGLKTIVRSEPQFKIIGEAGDAQQGYKLARSLNPDLIIVDISLPDQSGLKLTRELRALSAEVKILIVSMYSKIDYITEAFQAGALGYVVKESAADRLINGLWAIAQGEYYLDSTISHEVVSKLMELPAREARISDADYSLLTPREQEIMRFLAEGHSAKEIAEKLFISPKTVENHRANIMGKLGLHSTLELVRYAARLGLIDVDLWKV